MPPALQAIMKINETWEWERERERECGCTVIVALFFYKGARGNVISSPD